MKVDREISPLDWVGNRESAELGSFYRHKFRLNRICIELSLDVFYGSMSGSWEVFYKAVCWIVDWVGRSGNNGDDYRTCLLNLVSVKLVQCWIRYSLQDQPRLHSISLSFQVMVRRHHQKTVVVLQKTTECCWIYQNVPLCMSLNYVGHQIGEKEILTYYCLQVV